LIQLRHIWAQKDDDPEEPEILSDEEWEQLFMNEPEAENKEEQP
jgi:hypothetical protein